MTSISPAAPAGTRPASKQQFTGNATEQLVRIGDDLHETLSDMTDTAVTEFLITCAQAVNEAATVNAPPSVSFTAAQEPPMHDAELEAHITDCGLLMMEAMRRWAEFGNFADRGEADCWRMEMEDAIKLRSQATVARMERERGVA